MAFRADVDLMLWTLGNDPHQLQAAYHALRGSGLGRDLEPVWSCIGVHRPAEFNRGHTPACFSGVAPRPWVSRGSSSTILHAVGLPAPSKILTGTGLKEWKSPKPPFPAGPRK